MMANVFHHYLRKYTNQLKIPSTGLLVIRHGLGTQVAHAPAVPDVLCLGVELQMETGF